MNEQEIDLRELWQIVRANQKCIAKITGGFLGLAVAYLLIVPNTYQSTALLRIKQEKAFPVPSWNSCPWAMPSSPNSR